MALHATSSDCTEPIDWKRGLLVFLAVLALSMPQAALLPLLDRDEPRFAEASREMLQSGDYVVPMFNHAPRYAKPPLIYWCQTISFRLLGQNAFAARLPSLIATAATALLLVTWGMRGGSAQRGGGAGILYAFCLQTIQQGRVATADALLIFFMTLTAFTGWKIIRPKVPGRVPAICFIVLALGIAGGFLAKGPEALLPFFPLLWCARGAGRSVVTGLIASLMAGLALVLLWAIPAYVETNGDYWRVGMSEGVGERMVTGLQGHGATNFGGYLLSLPLYVLLFWLSALPWSPLLVIHRQKLFANWKRDLTDVYLLLNAGIIFVIFSLMVTKLPHYTLPAFPFLALALARRWFAVGLPECTLPKLGWLTGGALALLTALLVPIAIANNLTPSPVGKLVRDAQGVLSPQTQFAVVDFREPNAIWEMRRVLAGYGQFLSETDVVPFLNRPGPRCVILSSAVWQRDMMILNVGHPEWHVFEARGLNTAKMFDSKTFQLAYLDLTLVVKP
jgi:4-amino-4-deoxy-L-arabinose transferase-like glycosyltransferase